MSAKMSSSSPANTIPALSGDATATSLSSNEQPDGPPPTPINFINHRQVGAKRNVVIPNPAPQAYSQLLYNLYNNGSICGSNFGSHCDDVDPDYATKRALRPSSEGERGIPDWVVGTQAALSEEPQPVGTPPLEPPLSPTAGAPFMPQSQRLMKRRQETDAMREDEEMSDTDKTCLEDIYGPDDDAVSDVESLGPPITENEDYYVNRHLVGAEATTVRVTPLEELTERSGQPQDLSDQLQADIHQLRMAARGKPKMLQKIDLLQSDAIVVVEMTSKVSRRVGFLERCLEQSLPELTDEKANSALFDNLNHRLDELEKCLDNKGSEDKKASKNNDVSQPEMSSTVMDINVSTSRLNL